MEETKRRRFIIRAVLEGEADALEEPSSLWYQVTNFSCNGTNYLDTRIQLLKEDRDFTFMVKTQNEGLPQEQAISACVFHCMHEVDPYNGLSCQRRTNLNQFKIGYWGNNYNSPAKLDNGTINIFVIRHFENSNSFVIDMNTNGTISQQTISISNFVPVNEALLLGAYQDENGVIGRYWKGTVNDCTIYKEVLSDAEVSEYLGS